MNLEINNSRLKFNYYFKYIFIIATIQINGWVIRKSIKKINCL